MSAITVHLTGCIVKSVRADMLKNRATITMETYLDEEMMDAKRLLAILAVDESPVDLTIIEQQMRLPLHAAQPNRLAEARAEYVTDGADNGQEVG